MKFKTAIAAALIAAALPTAVQAAEFKDTKGHWAEAAVNRLADKGIVSGVSADKFNPEGIVTRAEFLRMIMGAANIKTSEYRKGECLDVKENKWYAGYVQGALDAGIIPAEMIDFFDVNVVFSDDGSRAIYRGDFQPDRPIMREEMAALAMTAYQYWTNVDTMQETKPSGEMEFIDIDRLSSWALPYMRLAIAQGFISGMDDKNLRPLATATRAQAAVLINNLMDKMQ